MFMVYSGVIWVSARQRLSFEMSIAYFGNDLVLRRRNGNVLSEDDVISIVGIFLSFCILWYS